MEREKDIAQVFDAELARLRDEAIFSTDGRIVAKYLAAMHQDVKSALLEQVAAGLRLSGVKSRWIDDFSDTVEVVFSFENADSEIDFVPQFIATDVNVESREVGAPEKVAAEVLDEEGEDTTPFVLILPPEEIDIDGEEAAQVDEMTEMFLSTRAPRGPRYVRPRRRRRRPRRRRKDPRGVVANSGTGTSTDTNDGADKDDVGDDAPDRVILRRPRARLPRSWV